MLKSAFFGAMTVGMALCLSISTPTLADDARHAHRGQRHHPHHHRGQHHRPSLHAPRHSVGHHHRHQHHVHQHGHHGHHHWPHGGFHVGVVLGGAIGYAVYPHGHSLHVHGPYCPVIIEKYVHHHVHVAPVWDVRYSPVRLPHAPTYLYVAISPGQAELYMDGQYLGPAHSFHNGQLQVPVAPGTHMLQLHLNGKAYTKAVEVRPGASALVTARLM